MSMNIFRVTGDAMHVASILLLLHAVRWRHNASGISLKSQEYYLLVFVSRYLDLFTMFCSMYNSCMKIFYVASTGYVVFALRCADRRARTEGEQGEANGEEEEGTGQEQHEEEPQQPQLQTQDQQQRQQQEKQQQEKQQQGKQQQRPARLTYSTDLDDEVWPYTGVVHSLLFLSYLFNVLTTSYGFLSFMKVLWTFSILLESVAMLPQLFLFRKNRHVPSHVNKFIALMGLYRLFYAINWVYRYYTEYDYRYRQHHLMYICAVIQVACYYDFAFYHARLWYQNHSERWWGSSLSSSSSSSATESAEQQEEGGMSLPLLPPAARGDESSATVAAVVNGIQQQCNCDPDAKDVPSSDKEQKTASVEHV